MCGYNYGHDAIAQFVTIPADALAANVFHSWMMLTTGSGFGARDILRLMLLDADSHELGQLGGSTNVSPANLWMTQSSADISAYRGQTIGVHIDCFTDDVLPTQWSVDEVALMVLLP